jgi:hypothetical protein
MSNKNENKKSLLDSIRTGITKLIGRSQVIPEPFQNADNTATIQSNDQFQSAVVPYVPSLPGTDSSTQSSNSSNSNSSNNQQMSHYTDDESEEDNEDDQFAVVPYVPSLPGTDSSTQSSNSSNSNSSNNQQDAPMSPSGSRLKPLSHYADDEAEEDNEDDETESEDQEEDEQQQAALPAVEEQPAYPMMAIPQEPSYPAVIRPHHSLIQSYNAANGYFLPAIPRELYAPARPTYVPAECKTPQDCEMANRLDNMLGFAQQQFSRLATFPIQALPRVNDPLFRLPNKPSRNSGDKEELLSDSQLAEVKKDAEAILVKLGKMRNTVKQASMNAYAAERCKAKAERVYQFQGDQRQRRADALDEARRAQIQFLQES